MKDKKSLKIIDFYKGIAILGVFLVHSRHKFPQMGDFLRIFELGQLGCQLFFILSGFTICFSWNRSRENSVELPYVDFGKKRFRSIWPGYCIMVISMCGFNFLMLNIFKIVPGFKSNSSLTAMICNNLLIHGVLPFCNNNVVFGGWYVGTTIVLYVLTPLLYKVIIEKRKGNIWYCWGYSLIVSTVLVVLYRKYQLPVLIQNNGFVYFSFVVQLPCYILGMILYRKYIYSEEEKLRKKINIVMECMLWVTIIFVFYSKFRYKALMFPILVGSAFYLRLRRKLLHNCVTKGKLLRKIGEKVAVSLGENSYYIYLIHVFFVYEIPNIIFEFLNGANLKYNSKGIYLILLFPLIVLTYFSSGLLKQACKRITEKW